MISENETGGFSTPHLTIEKGIVDKSKSFYEEIRGKSPSELQKLAEELRPAGVWDTFSYLLDIERKIEYSTVLDLLKK